jgi:hypothetical protein
MFFLGVVMRHAAEGKFGHQMVGPGQPLQFRNLLDAVLRRADDLDLEMVAAEGVPAVVRWRAAQFK